MNKHLDILEQLLIRYWNKHPLWWDNKWDTLSSSKKHTYIIHYIYNRLKYNYR